MSCGAEGMRTVRILVDESAYDLLNIGDVAMLQACVVRLRQLWPGAEIMVIAHAPERLISCCPGTLPIGRTHADLPIMRPLPMGVRLACEQAWKVAAPYTSHRLRGSSLLAQPRTAIQAVRAADLVVASGGGYVTDTWWWHAAGVLSLLSLAQRLGKPTAMFGQGIGPMGRRALRAQARGVLPKLAVLGLREDRIGRDLALSLGVPTGAVTVTGDDALELITGSSVADGHALGVNIRASGYANIDPACLTLVGDLLLQAAKALEAPVVALPVSRYPADADLGAIRALLRPRHGGPGHGRPGVVLRDLATPQDLITAAAGCRAIVTGSYHAAVFGLAQGVPAVCLTKSPYYDAKFAGLRALFPSACFVVSLARPDIAAPLRGAIEQAWHLPNPAREAARDAAARQRRAGRRAYAQFREAVEHEPVMAAASGPGLIA
jgi:polysaccharide pyruvyl transferase WcaK-like protein